MTVAGCGPEPDAGTFTPSPAATTAEPTFAPSPSPSPTPSPVPTVAATAPPKPRAVVPVPRRAGPRVTSAPKVIPPKPKPPAAAYYANCAAVRAAGKAPLYRGQPGYRTGLDRDHDGIACDVTA